MVHGDDGDGHGDGDDGDGAMVVMVMVHGVPCRPVDPKHYISNQIGDSQKNQ